MSNSLREKLLGLGFKAPEPERKPEPRPRQDRRPEADAGKNAKPGERRGDGRPRSAGKPGESRGRPDRKPGAPHGRPAGKPGESNGRPAGKPGQGSGKPRPSRPRTQEEIDLGKAYAIRAQKEKEERIEAERLRQEEARLRREAKARLAEFLKDKSVNDPAAEIARHFPYGGKIKRVHVTEAQLKALNAGELGVVQLDGRYLLVPAALLAEVEAIFAPALALRVDPDAPAGDDPYADPQYQVPDDLVW
ncbi:DUF2058 domain-containing protein [Arenimonas terrae]|jgi:uncharacterized protein YaiL (DUF2058 family)|uniref:DUF2058 family protein n=1 Tax=Arenimonas terrae TaxID=2546226 RepID=A0A5C4RUY6_9GAMM|nr:DUF2058 family protein [Arenimonas terrae]TNJ34477.1 DUF2058 family protein [Arenimonas terrae]